MYLHLVSKLGPNDTLGGFWGANSHLIKTKGSTLFVKTIQH
jgi:hypothetical protein